MLAKIYKQFGVSTIFKTTTIRLQKSSIVNRQSPINFDLANAPDIAQTIAVTAFGLGLECYLTGLHTLKIKETDRLVALKTELEKLGAEVVITNDSLHLSKSDSITEDVSIDTYNDHRMAMAFAPLVSKSYPKFLDDLSAIGFKIK